MPVLSKKGIIKSLWVDLLCLAFLGLGEPACFHDKHVDPERRMQQPDVGFSLSDPALRAAPESAQRPPNFSPPKPCLY